MLREFFDRVPSDLRRAIPLAAIICLLAGAIMFAYALFASTGAAPYFAEVVRRQMIVSAIAATVCLFPGVLYLIRYFGWSSKKARHPSVPLALLATLSLLPLLFSLAMLFFT